MTRSAIAAMTAYTLELRDAETKLNQNESPYDFPAELKQELATAMLSRDWNRYPEFEATSLRTAIAKNWGIAAENVLVGNGSNELLAATISTFIGPGTPIVIPRPTFALYEKLATVAGGEITHVDVDPTAGVLPLDGIIAAARQGGVIIVCSPNNPTGGVLPDAAIEKLLATGATLLFDRAYGDFADDSLPPLHPRLVTFSTFSKAWGLAGLRIGWLAATADTCREIRKVKLPYSLNIISEAAAELALRHAELRDRNVKLLESERDRMIAAMLRVDGIELFPTRANFISFRTAKRSKAIFDGLLDRGILIRDISGYHGLANCLRVSVGAPDENDAFLEALKELA